MKISDSFFPFFLLLKIDCFLKQNILIIVSQSWEGVSDTTIVQAPDLSTTDAMMEVHSGFETLQVRRQHHLTKQEQDLKHQSCSSGGVTKCTDLVFLTFLIILLLIVSDVERGNEKRSGIINMENEIDFWMLVLFTYWWYRKYYLFNCVQRFL